MVFDNQDNVFSAKQCQQVNCTRYLDVLHALSVRIIRAAMPLSCLCVTESTRTRMEVSLFSRPPS